MEQIFFDEKSKTFLLHTETSSYAFGISPQGLPIHLYFGSLLRGFEDLPDPEQVWNCFYKEGTKSTYTRQEYPAFHASHYTENALLVSYPGGARNTRLHFVESNIRTHDSGEILEVKFQDTLHKLDVSLFYKVYHN